MIKIYFEVGKEYTRKEIKTMIGLPKNVIEKNFNYFSFGFPKHNDTFYIFSNIGKKTKTGHSYLDHFTSEKVFIWYPPKKSHLKQERIKDIMSDKYKKMLFIRTSIQKGFTFYGYLTYDSVINNEPLSLKFLLLKVSTIKNTQELLDIIQKNDSFVKEEYKFKSDDLFYEAKKSNEPPAFIKINVNVPVRNSYVNTYIKNRANGFCELCGLKAPFIKKDGEPYLEVHHIVSIYKNGIDSIDNCIALCPNCHRELHYGELSDSKRLIVEKIIADTIKNKKVNG